MFDTGAPATDSDPAGDGGDTGGSETGETADTTDTAGDYAPGFYVDCAGGDDASDGLSPAIGPQITSFGD